MSGLIEVAQNTPEWLRARCGSLGASAVHEAIARTKSGYGASRANLCARLVAERLTGMPADNYVNAAMQWGHDQEPNARARVAEVLGVEVRETGLYRHPTIFGTHASPDGLVGEQEMVEIKCPNTATHIETLLNRNIAHKYWLQMQWQMACAGRSVCHYASYDPRLPADLQLYVQRVERDDNALRELEEQVAGFLVEVEDKVRRLQALRA